MFENLSEKLHRVIKDVTGRGKLTEDNIQETLRSVRLALLEADVALPVVKDFIESLKTKALGAQVATHLNPAQAFLQIVQNALIELMGKDHVPLNLQCQPPAVILMAGLQGSGKTTTSGKLAKLLQEKFKKSVMLTSCDIYRPAAIEQLKTVATQVGAHYFPSDPTQQPVAIATNAITQCRREAVEVLIIDTAGRLHIDNDMMAEIKALQTATQSIETLFVVDAMTGQDAANTAKSFGETLPLTGVILTKLDGDARGGAALSVKAITGKPIKYIGVGEKLDALEAFHPERITSRILGMGDVLSLIEEIEQKTDKAKAEKLAKKMQYQKGKGIDLEDFRDQLLQMNHMGGMTSLLAKMPGMGQLTQSQQNKVSDKNCNRSIAIINSMTPKERRFPALLNKGSRKKRVALGAGTTLQEVNQLLKQFEKMQKMMTKLTKKGGMQQMMRQMESMMAGQPGQLPFPPDRR